MQRGLQDHTQLLSLESSVHLSCKYGVNLKTFINPTGDGW